MNNGTAILLGFLAGVIAAPIVMKAIGGNQAAPPRMIPKKQESARADNQLMGLRGAQQWDCTQAKWLQNNIRNFNKGFGLN